MFSTCDDRGDCSLVQRTNTHGGRPEQRSNGGMARPCRRESAAAAAGEASATQHCSAACRSIHVAVGPLSRQWEPLCRRFLVAELYGLPSGREGRRTKRADRLEHGRQTRQTDFGCRIFWVLFFYRNFIKITAGLQSLVTTSVNHTGLLIESILAQTRYC